MRYYIRPLITHLVQMLCSSGHSSIVVKKPPGIFFLNLDFIHRNDNSVKKVNYGDSSTLWHMSVGKEHEG